jgi:hypothetical protein
MKYFFFWLINILDINRNFKSHEKSLKEYKFIKIFFFFLKSIDLFFFFFICFSLQ